MSQEEVQRIKEIFSELKLNPEYLEHEPVITSQDAAKTRDFDLKQGIKAILFTDDKNDWAICCVPGDKKVDQKKMALALGWPKGNVRMATHEEVLEQTGCEIGSVPPFGHKNKIRILVDNGVYENKISAFNIGLRTRSVKIETPKMREVFSYVDAIEGDYAK